MASEFDDDTVVRADASYIITGGWGALGAEVADWLIERGAKHLVLSGRSQPGEDVQSRIDGWRSHGVTVDCVAGDLADSGTAAQVVAAAVTHAPLRGVVHAAGVLRDQLLPAMTAVDFDTVWRAKAEGARRILDAAPASSLDFCVMFSSMASGLGSAGQGNYASANGYLDGLALSLRQQGVPAVSLRWGPWAERGMSARLDSTARDRLGTWGFGFLAVREARELFGRLFASDSDPLIVRWDRSAFSSAWTGGPQGLFANVLVSASEAKPADEDIAWMALAGEDRAAAVKQEGEDAIRRILGWGAEQSVPSDKGLFDLGVDSLSAVDLKNRLQNSLRIKIPATLVFDYPTVTAMVEFLASQGTMPSAPAEPELSDLDEDDLERLLAKELGE